MHVLFHYRWLSKFKVLFLRIDHKTGLWNIPPLTPTVTHRTAQTSNKSQACPSCWIRAPFSLQFKWWKFCFTLTLIPIQWSLKKTVHGTTAVLSWHVQQFVIWWPAMELQQGEVSIEFELWAKNRQWNVHHGWYGRRSVAARGRSR